jgi:hypothetical protein
MTASKLLGVYGYRLEGLAPSDHLLVRLAPQALPMRVEVFTANQPIPRDFPALTEELLEGGRMGVDATRGLAVYYFPSKPPADDMVHPWLVPAVSRLAVASGRVVIHGGVIAANGRAVAVIADREGGKSSLLAFASVGKSGFSVLADDLVVLDALQVNAGPRCIDLRIGTASRLAELDLHPSRSGSRYRLMLPPCEADARLVGFVHLKWSQSVQMTPLSPSRRLAELIPHMSASTQPGRLAALLDLASLPAWHLSRPRDWGAIDDALQLVARAIGDS